MNTHPEARFLVVDDFATMRRILRAQLQDIGCLQVEEAEDGAVALAKLEAQPFDVVVTDVNMPNMNGFELLKAIKADDSLEHIAVLMVTAEVRKEDIVLAAECGAAGYIVKPFTRAVLEAKLQKMLPRQNPAAC